METSRARRSLRFPPVKKKQRRESSIDMAKLLRFAALICLALPSVAQAASGDGPAQVGKVLFALALLLLTAKGGGFVAERLGQPAVLGELLIGIDLPSLALSSAPGGWRRVVGFRFPVLSALSIC